MKRIVYLLLAIIMGILMIHCDSNQAQALDGDEVVASQMVADTSISLDYIMGKFDPQTHPDFVEVPEEFANRKGHLLHRDTWDAFQRMHDHAQRDSVELTIISATRNFDSQKRIWEAKWTGERLVEGGQNLAETTPDPEERALVILRYSSMPSTSRHHWGSDIDLNALSNRYFASGKGKQEYDWLSKHAADYGFCQPYTAKDSLRPDGYYEEKWHWSYLPVARKLTDQVALRMRDDLISGFAGDSTAQSIGVVNKYMLGINQQCKN